MEVILDLNVNKVKGGYLWASMLSVGNRKKNFSGQYEGPITLQQAYNYALVETVQHLKKPCAIILRSAPKRNNAYFKEAFEKHYRAFGKSGVVSFVKGEPLEIKHSFISSGPTKIVEHDDFSEFI